MKPKYKKFYILEKHSSIKNGSTEALYYAKINGVDEWDNRVEAQKALNSKYEAHKRLREQGSSPWAKHIHKTANSYCYTNWETRYIYKIVEL